MEERARIASASHPYKAKTTSSTSVPLSHSSVFCGMETVLGDHLSSSLLHLFDLLALFLTIAAGASIFLHKLHPAYQLFPIACMLLLQVLRKKLLLSSSSQVYLVDFSCLRPPPRLRVPVAGLLEHLSLIDCFDRESVAFMAKVIASSGLGEETYFPPSLHYIPPSTRHGDSIQEARALLFPVLGDLLAKTGLSPRDIDVLVVNCSGFCPSPSLSSLVVNHFAMRDDVRSFNISGMGCSAGAIGVDIARALLAGARRRSYAVVISAEILSTGWYSGRDRRKLLLNCVFRTGSAAVLLTNRKSPARPRPKYRLLRCARTQRAFDDRAYRSAIREEDAEGVTGFSIERYLPAVAAETLRDSAAAVGASLLPLREKVRYVVSAHLQSTKKGGGGHVPDFRSVVRHYCLPASGKAVIRAIASGLGLGEEEAEAAQATFHRFGNQSAASLWYQLAYMEAKGRVKAKDKVWQLGGGSGPKCNSLVWECERELVGEAAKGPWADCVSRYPLKSW